MPYSICSSKASRGRPRCSAVAIPCASERMLWPPNMGVLVSSGAKNRAQSSSGPLQAARWIDGIELAVERRKFDRNVHSRQPYVLIAVDLGNFRPGVHGRAEVFDQIEIRLLPAVGF